ncbi:MAG: ParB N-terminal domain-containing protein [Oscillospiraceae bacterium]|nr:ParB N-terminal domain-containing protein [Oscillospiraceae bacterium]
MARKLNFDSSIAMDIKSAADDSFKDNIKMVDADKIKPSIENFYSLDDIDILADDIERQGLKHNLVVYEDEKDNGTYFIKSGHRRYAAICQLISQERYNSKYIPCLVDGKKTKSECMYDLIMLNATSRVISDSELYKQYEILKDVLDELKSEGKKVKGRLREIVAAGLSVSPAQVGKIENIKHNGVDEVKKAVETGDMSIATADKLAKLPAQQQKSILSEKPVSKIKSNDAAKSNSDHIKSNEKSAKHEINNSRVKAEPKNNNSISGTKNTNVDITVSDFQDSQIQKNSIAANTVHDYNDDDNISNKIHDIIITTNVNADENIQNTKQNNFVDDVDDTDVIDKYRKKLENIRNEFDSLVSAAKDNFDFLCAIESMQKKLDIIIKELHNGENNN